MEVGHYFVAVLVFFGSTIDSQYGRFSHRGAKSVVLDLPPLRRTQPNARVPLDFHPLHRILFLSDAVMFRRRLHHGLQKPA